WPDVFQRSTERGCALPGMVGPHLANDGVHRVIGTPGIDGQPADAAGFDPVRELARRARVLDEVARFVGRDWSALRRPVGRVETVIPGVDDQDVPALNADARLLFPALEVLRAVDLVVAQAHFLQVDNAR